MTVRAHIIVGAAVEAGPEGIDADEDSIGAVAAEQDGFGVIEAGDPILDGQERAGGHWLTVLDLFANADHLGGRECGLEEALELRGSGGRWNRGSRPLEGHAREVHARAGALDQVASGFVMAPGGCFTEFVGQILVGPRWLAG